MTWRDIEKDPPVDEMADGTEVLTYRRAGLMAVACWLPEIGRWCVTDGCGLVHVNPLATAPAPPADTGERG